MHLDVAFPPLFAALVAMCFLLNIIPFLIALFVVPMAFLMGTSLCLVKGEFRDAISGHTLT